MSAVAVGGAALLLLAGCAATSSPAVDAGAQAGTVAQSRGTAGSVLATANDTAPGTAPSTDSTVAAGTDGSTTTALAPGSKAGVSTTTAPAGASTLVPTTRSGGVAPPIPSPVAPITPVPTAAPTTAAPPVLNASGPIDPVTQQPDQRVHCMGTATSVMVSPTWTTTGATSVAVARGDVPDAFQAPVNEDLKRLSGTLSYSLICPSVPEAAQYTTVTALGPGGKTTAVITWTIHKM